MNLSLFLFVVLGALAGWPLWTLLYRLRGHWRYSLQGKKYLLPYVAPQDRARPPPTQPRL